MNQPSTKATPGRVVKGATLRTLRVREIMTREVFTVAASTSIDDAARSLSFHRVSGAPVLEHGRIVGVVSKTDLVDPRRNPRGSGDSKVADVMTHVIFAVREGDPATMAVRLMANESIHRVIVVAEGGKIAGIVTSMDIVRAVARGVRFDDTMPASADGVERHADPAQAIEYVDLRTFEVGHSEGC